MKILQPGKATSWCTQTTCTGHGNGGGGCGAILLVEATDLFKTTTHARDETETFITFACIQCGVLTDLVARVPSYITDKLPIRNPGSRRGEGAK